MIDEKPPLPERNVYGKVNIFQSIVRYFETHILAQVLLGVLIVAVGCVLFHDYLPTPQDIWYDLRPSEKEMTYQSSDQMQFVDEKNGKFIIWYETLPGGYRFFNQHGFYGAGQERELADTPERIQKLKDWVDQTAAKKKQEQDKATQLQQSQSTIEKLIAQIAVLKESQKAQEEKNAAVVAQTTAVEAQNTPVEATAVPGAPIVTVLSEPTPVTVVEDPAFYQHGAIIPPNPKPLAWFQSLRWGVYPGKPYLFNRNTGFFEIPGKPETRIAPHPHFIARNERTGLLERPYTRFVQLNGQVPEEMPIPLLDKEYYQEKQAVWGATFDSMYPYDVTAAGVTY